MLKDILRAKADDTEGLGLTGPGVERLKIAALDTAYRNYKPHREKFAEASRAHVEQKKKLMEKLRNFASELPKDEAGNAFYVTSDDMRLTLESKEKLVLCEEDEEE